MIVFLFGWSIYLFFFSNESLVSSHLFISRLCELWTQIEPVKCNSTLKCDFDIQHLMYLVLNDDLHDSWNLCLFIWLLWVYCFWTGLKIWIVIKNVLPNVWSLILLIFFECDGVRLEDSNIEELCIKCILIFTINFKHPLEKWWYGDRREERKHLD